MKKLIANYHTHTYRCGHASMEPDENYVIEAIKSGLKDLGFSDHAPFKRLTHERMRMEFGQFPDYLESIRNLKEKYFNDITIHLGLECEYYENKIEYYKELFNKYKIDYLILGQHLRYNDEDEPVNYFKKDKLQGFINYKNDLIKGMKSGFFKYVCHPDIFMNFVSEITPEVDKIMNEICLEALIDNLPLEINLHGEFKNKDGAIARGCLHYPSPYFFRKAKEMGNKFIFGIDAHNSKEISEIDYSFLEEFLKETNISEEDIIDMLVF